MNRTSGNREQQRAEGAPVLPSPATGPATRRGEPDRPAVLLVDDNADNLVALEAMLRREDIEIVTARSGRDALEVLLGHDVAVAVIDVMMPEMDGFELAELIRGVDRTRHVPIIFVTAGSKAEYRIFTGYQTGAIDFLFKPLDEQVLRSKVDVLVKLEKQRRQLDLAREQAERARAELEQTLRYNEIFAGVLAHDLRNPLGAILNAAQYVLLSPDKPDVEKPVTQILSSGKRMARLIEQLLDFTRARVGGGIQLEPRAANLVDVCGQAVREIEVAHAEWRVQVESLGDLRGTWDPDRLHQVVSNLVANAGQHGTSGGTILLRLDGTEPDSVTLEVHNCGSIEAALLSTLFAPFRGTRERRSDGLGLGLFIAREIVTGHGGHIDVASSDAAGTIFKVWLPRHAPPRPRDADNRPFAS